MNAIKPQDVLVLIKLISCKNDTFLSQKDLSDYLDISRTEVSFAFERLKNIGLISIDKKCINKLAAFEFFRYALKYIFPIEIQGMDRGVLIGPSAEFIKNKVISNETYILPCSDGSSNGLAVLPIYPINENTLTADIELYHLLSTVEILRGLGSVRHHKEAVKDLEKFLK